MAAHIQRAWLLYGQSRCDLAEQELRQELACEPDHAEAHALLALCLVERKEYQPATDEARAAVHLAPDLPFAHSALSRVQAERNYLPEALAAVREALRLDPSSVPDHALLAQVQFNLRDWAAALESAEQGLRLDAEHVGCNNLRAMALVKLGRKAEAGLTIESTLARDPEDAYSHANMGWTYLEQREPNKALESFREALRLDPELAWARAGIVEALKARYFIYRIMLAYFLWMAKLGRGSQWLVIIGGLVGFRVVRSMADQNPALAPWLWPLLWTYLGFILLTWLADPLFNWLLQFNRFGRLCLTREQAVGANCIGILLTLALLAGAACLLSGSFIPLPLAIFFGLLALPVSGIFMTSAGWPRWAMTGYTAVIAAVGLASVAFCYLLNENAMMISIQVFMWGVFLSTWVANGLAMARVRQ